MLLFVVCMTKISRWL